MAKRNGAWAGKGGGKAADAPKGASGAPGGGAAGPPTSDYRHKTTKRKNIPPAKIAAEGTIPAIPKARYAYSPHLAPVLRFDPAADADRATGKIAALIDKAAKGPLTERERATLREALDNREPWLEWATKREQHQRGMFEVDPVALHIHERVSAQAIMKVAARQDVTHALFADPEQSYNEAVQFYRHDIDWTNRLILGDSLQVMSSLAKREDLAGKVQMIYMDPPYGIKFASNFQPEVGKRDVKDKQEDLTREPEMVRAYRDTWHLGIHSYLSYLRDRLITARELLADTGSIFVQINDENLHRVQQLFDEVFGSENYIVTIVVQKKGSQKGDFIQPINDYLLWYAKDKTQAKHNPVYDTREVGSRGGAGYRFVETTLGDECQAPSDVETFDDTGAGRFFASNPLTSGGVRANQSLPFEFRGRTFEPGTGACWKTKVRTDEPGLPGMTRLSLANRLFVGDKQLRFKSYVDDFGGVQLTNFWTGIGGAPDPVYVVQTNPKIIERCMLMTTDPGDLVLDPTCGSGTTAYVAEQWGRRWITTDTSRVAIAIARQRLLTAKFDHYRTRLDGKKAGNATFGGAQGGSAGTVGTSVGTVARREGTVGTREGTVAPREGTVGTREGTVGTSAGTVAPRKGTVGTSVGMDRAGTAGSAAGNGSRPNNPGLGFLYKTVPHITLKSIAQNTNLDPIFSRHAPILEERLK